jgi:hypothetical protein
MASNNLDFGAVGNSPVISAQAANIQFKEISKALPLNHGKQAVPSIQGEIVGNEFFPSFIKV